VRCITDEDVPDDVMRFLTSRGHEVLPARDHFMPGSADWVIARGASDRLAVVVTWNVRHFMSLAKRRRDNGEPRYPGMSLIAFSCSHPHGRDRLESVIDEIEATFEIRVVRRGGRLIVEVGETMLKYDDG
jgi:hypothetical protein